MPDASTTAADDKDEAKCEMALAPNMAVSAVAVTSMSQRCQTRARSSCWCYREHAKVVISVRKSAARATEPRVVVFTDLGPAILVRRAHPASAKKSTGAKAEAP